MLGFPIGVILLLLVSVLIYFGLAQRVLDRLQLSDRAALGIIAAIIIGGFINIPFRIMGIQSALNVGGGLIPLGLAIYLFRRAGTSWERIRALLATVATAVVIFLINSVWMGGDPYHNGRDFVDPLYVYPLVGGFVAYLFGRSRRAAFIAGTMGVFFLDLYDFAWLIATGTPGAVLIGGAGAFDAIVLSGVIAVLLADLIGELRERLQGGPATEGRPQALLKHLNGVGNGKVNKMRVRPKPGKVGGEEDA